MNLKGRLPLYNILMSSWGIVKHTYNIIFQGSSSDSKWLLRCLENPEERQQSRFIQNWGWTTTYTLHHYLVHWCLCVELMNCDKALAKTHLVLHLGVCYFVIRGTPYGLALCCVTNSFTLSLLHVASLLVLFWDFTTLISVSFCWVWFARAPCRILVVVAVDLHL